MPKYREERNFFQENYLLIFIVGTISISLSIIFFFSYIKTAQQNTIKNNNDKTLGLMTSSETKSKEAQELLSKNASNSAVQEKTKKLLQEAIDDAKKATELQPDDPKTWYYLSEVYQKLFNVNPQAASLAKDALNRAIALSPNTDTLYEKRATAYIFLKSFKDAEKDLLQAIKLKKTEGNYHYKLGNVYKELGEKERAKAAYIEAKKLTTSDNKLGLAQIDVQLKSLDKPSTAAAKISSKPTQKLQPTPKPTQPLIKLGI